MSSFTSNINLRFPVTGSKTLELSTLSANINENISHSLAAGTGDDQIDTAMNDSVTIGAASSQDYDLDDNTTIVDLFNDAVAFAKVKAILVKNTGSGDLNISGDFLGLTTDNVPVPTGGWAALNFGAAGRTVTAATADVLTLASTAGTTAEIIVLGVAA